MADFFEKKGIDYQLSCKNKEECDETLEFSCLCCRKNTRFLWKSCDRCPIQITHDEMCAYFDDEARRKKEKGK